MGALYLASKLEECPLRMRDLINVYDLLLQRASHSFDRSAKEFKYQPMSYFGTTFYELKDALVVAEMQILKRLGFNVNVVLPYGTLVNYLRVLGLTSRADVCTRAWGYLNDACVFVSLLVYSFTNYPMQITNASLCTLRDSNYCLCINLANRSALAHFIALYTTKLLVGFI
jgi:cyclin L